MADSKCINHNRAAGTCTRCGHSFAECFSAASCDANVSLAKTGVLDLTGMSRDDAERRYREHQYGYVTCSGCGRRWQRIDYGCSHHVLVCGYPVPPRVEVA